MREIERECGRLCNYTGASEMYRVFTFVVNDYEIGISFFEPKTPAAHNRVWLDRLTCTVYQII